MMLEMQKLKHIICRKLNNNFNYGTEFSIVFHKTLGLINNVKVFLCFNKKKERKKLQM